ncbi:tRNA wybutosine-synthesizing protein 5 isoform X2 [Oryzias melastigma]|uniref:tRNA wybutosine-synthesizing protein 5 isoform X2 n=1 Tax=Oryzias melastigma TaxID=30732 RepID=UPI000CF7B417|nr:tRNA wybutosine-synthesizing protein 5 isoform X2 [Oryzias melastigma]
MEQQEIKSVSIFTGVDREKFLQEIYPERRPAVLRGVPLGPCQQLWTTEYLAQQGGDKEVKIHVSTVPQMDFLRKNFVYRTLPFNEFVKRASEKKHSDFFLCEEESYYLRSLGEDVRKEPADLRKQFPNLAEDFLIPPFFEPDQFFSSVFRISSCGLQLWTHYDVMDNLLAQGISLRFWTSTIPTCRGSRTSSERVGTSASCSLEICSSSPPCGSTTRSPCSLAWASTCSGATCLRTATTGRTRTGTKTRRPRPERCRHWTEGCTLWRSCPQTTGTSTAAG